MDWIQGSVGSLVVATGQMRAQYVISKINECCEDCYVHRASASASAAVRQRAQLLLKRRPSSSHFTCFFAAGAGADARRRDAVDMADGSGLPDTAALWFVFGLRARLPSS